MIDLLKKTVLAAVLGLAAFAVTVPAASAASPDAAVETVGYRSGFHGHHERWERDRRPHDRHARGRCSPRLAVAKARDYGLRRAHVAHVSRRHVVVEGVRFGHHGRIAFANQRHCPVLWR